MKLIIGAISSISVAAITWYMYYKYKKECNCNLLKTEEFLKRHNCVVIYGKMRMSGWAAYPGRYSPDLSNTQVLFEPIIYFIRTAERELKIAVMFINALSIIEAIQAALIKGVKVQIIVSFEVPLNLDLEKLIELGAELRYYIGSGIESIMHYKYAIKDSDKSGYALYGSLNWTVSGFFENYENCVFTGNKIVVQAIKRNFNVTWDRLTSLCESDEIRDKILEAKHRSQLNS